MIYIISNFVVPKAIFIAPKSTIDGLARILSLRLDVFMYKLVLAGHGFNCIIIPHNALARDLTLVRQTIVSLLYSVTCTKPIELCLQLRQHFHK